MSYTETTWKKGDAITAEKLNNIEGGIKANENAISQGGTSLMTVTYTYDSETRVSTTQATFGEVLEAFENGVTVMFITSSENSGYVNHQSSIVIGVRWDHNENNYARPYSGTVGVSGSDGTWVADQPTDSPAQTFEELCACTLSMS